MKIFINPFSCFTFFCTLIMRPPYPAVLWTCYGTETYLKVKPPIKTTLLSRQRINNPDFLLFLLYSVFQLDNLTTLLVRPIFSNIFMTLLSRFFYCISSWSKKVQKYSNPPKMRTILTTHTVDDACKKNEKEKNHCS